MSKVKPIYLYLGRSNGIDEDGKNIVIAPYCEVTNNNFSILELSEDEKYYSIYEISLPELKGIVAMMESLSTENGDNNGTIIRMTARNN